VPGSSAARPASRRQRRRDDLLRGLDAHGARRSHDDAARLEAELVTQIGQEVSRLQRVVDPITLEMVEIGWFDHLRPRGRDC
jgi:hypothetical protein